MTAQTIDNGDAYYIQPSNEPFGEGNGWDECTEAAATQWQVWEEGPYGTIVSSHDTRKDAEAYLAALTAKA